MNTGKLTYRRFNFSKFKIHVYVNKFQMRYLICDANYMAWSVLLDATRHSHQSVPDTAVHFCFISHEHNHLALGCGVLRRDVICFNYMYINTMSI